MSTDSAQTRGGSEVLAHASFQPRRPGDLAFPDFQVPLWNLTPPKFPCPVGQAPAEIPSPMKGRFAEMLRTFELEDAYFWAIAPQRGIAIASASVFFPPFLKPAHMDQLDGFHVFFRTGPDAGRFVNQAYYFQVEYVVFPEHAGGPYQHFSVNFGRPGMPFHAQNAGWGSHFWFQPGYGLTGAPHGPDDSGAHIEIQRDATRIVLRNLRSDGAALEYVTSDGGDVMWDLNVDVPGKLVASGPQKKKLEMGDSDEIIFYNKGFTESHSGEMIISFKNAEPLRAKLHYAPAAG